MLDILSNQMRDNVSKFEEYRRGNSSKILFIIVCVVLLLIAALVSLSVGTRIGFGRTAEVVFNHLTGVTYPKRSPEWWEDYYIFQNVMPEVVVAIIAGAGLAVTGVIMQSIMNNPLADPYTTGISSGASLGAVTAIIMGYTFSSIAGEMGIVSNAFIGAMVPALIIILLSKRVGNSPATIILIGTAISYFFNALTTLIMITADSEALQSAYMWQIGSVAGVSWSSIPLMLVIVTASSIFAILLSRSLNLMTLGDESARSLGMDAERLRMVCIMVSSFLIASIVSYTGIIGFVGLVSPHIVRFVVGSDNRFVIPASIVAGALLLTVALMLSRLLNSFGYIPIGVVVSFIGAPIFLYLVVRDKSGREIW
jgi:iron complex transport system permease protein